MGTDVHLWEADHDYYCNRGNYYAPGNDQPQCHYKSWADFISAEGDADMDFNLLFRWDWYEGGFGGSEFTGDDNYRNGELQLCWIGQRKGLYRWATIEVCRADEPVVREWLQPRLNHFAALWLPLVPQPSASDCASPTPAGSDA